MNYFAKRREEMNANLIREVYEEEVKFFIWLSKEEYPENRINGRYTKNISYERGKEVLVSLPLCRCEATNFESSVIKKYARYTNEVFKDLEESYVTGNHLISMLRTINKSKVPSKLQAEMKEKYTKMYLELINKERVAPVVVKMDATHLGKSSDPKRLVVYSVFGYHADGKKECLYFDIQNGSETRKGWEKVVKHLKLKIDFSSTELIVTDMFQSLKFLLKEFFPKIALQNCIFHRMQSLTDALAETPKKRKATCSKHYHEIKNAKTREEVEEIFEKFKSYTYKQKKQTTTGKRHQKGIDKMLKVFYEDNFTFLDFPHLDINLILTTNALEGYHSGMKKYISNNLRDKNIGHLQWKIMMYLDSRNLLPVDLQ